MSDFVLQFICSFLFAMSFIFVFVEIRAGFDRSFIVFAVSNVLLCTFCAIDIWIQPEELQLHWTRFQHQLSAYFAPFLAWYLMILTRRVDTGLLRLFMLVATVMAAVLSTNLFLRETPQGVVTSALYTAVFAPYMLGSIVTLVWFIIAILKRAETSERRVLVMHLAGIVALGLFGLLDMFSLMAGIRSPLSLPNASVMGVLTFAVLTTLVFADRLAMLVREREETFEKLQVAYQELDEARSLRELGQSTAIINHEIRNYMFGIAGHAQIALKSPNLEVPTRRCLEQILSASAKLTLFSREILEFSKSRIVRDKASVDMLKLIHNCIDSHLMVHADLFSISGASTHVNGQWGKLEQVFLNVFRNSLEADAGRIEIRLVSRGSVLLTVVDDDGVGCTEEQLANMFRAFYTSKGTRRGTGLGMALVRSVIESHGGHVSAYSKNLLGDGSHGLKLEIVLPVYGSPRPAAERHGGLVVIKAGVPNLDRVIRVFQNVDVTPRILQDQSELDTREFQPGKTVVLAATATVNRIHQRYGTTYVTHTLVGDGGRGVLVSGPQASTSVEMFCEDFVLSELLRGVPACGFRDHASEPPEVRAKRTAAS